MGTSKVTCRRYGSSGGSPSASACSIKVPAFCQAALVSGAAFNDRQDVVLLLKHVYRWEGSLAGRLIVQPVTR